MCVYLRCNYWQHPGLAGFDFKRVSGGLLVQERDIGLVARGQFEVVTERKPTPAQIADLLFAWKVAKMVKSNAIVYAKDQSTIGVGARPNEPRQFRPHRRHQSRTRRPNCGRFRHGVRRLFPFRDGLDNAASVGIAAVIQPGGSMRDEEVIAAANEHGIAMVFTRMRHFRH